MGEKLVSDLIQSLVTRLEDAARRGGAKELDIICLRQLLLHRRQSDTLTQAMRVSDIERTLKDRTPGERREIVCERLNISRSRYYALRDLSDEIVSSPAHDRTGEQ